MIGGVITGDRLAALQKQEEELFVKLHPKSQEISTTLLKSNWLGGVPMPWMNRLPGSFPLTVDDANGAHFTDADNITYTDFCLGDTGAMTGHAVPEVAEAVSERVRRGITTMMPSSDAAYVSSELSRRFGLPLWQMAMTATDANRFVLRYARYITKKPKIVVMDWCYHGTVDETLAVLNENGEIVPRPGAIGPQCDVNITTRVAHFNDITSLENCFKNNDCACLLMEPALTNIGIVLPIDGYLVQVKELCVKYNVLLIIDETHTICCSPGGCTASWKLQPDFLVIGKPIGGGMPAAAYGMTQAVADKLKQHLMDDSVDVSGVGGTLTGNALALAAVKATLSSTLRDEDYAYMIPLATAWTNGVNNTIKEFNLPWNVQQLGCRSEYWFCPPPINGAQAAATSFHELETYLHLFCLNRGILLTPFHNMALFSPQHTIEDVDKHTKVFREGVISLVEAMK